MSSHDDLMAGLGARRAELEAAERKERSRLIKRLRGLPLEERRQELCAAPEALILAPSTRRDLMREAEDESKRGCRGKLALASATILAAGVLMIVQAVTLAEMSSTLQQWRATGRAPLTVDQQRALERIDAVGVSLSDMSTEEVRQRLTLPLPGFELQQFLAAEDGAAPERARAITVFLGVAAMGTPEEQRRLVDLLHGLMSDSPGKNETLKRLCRAGNR